MDTYQLLRAAVLNRQQAQFYYDGHLRVCCPHAVGMRDGKRRVMAFQFGGGSSNGLPPGGQWRCFEIVKIDGLGVQDGPWHTGSSHTRPNSCITIVDVETRG